MINDSIVYLQKNKDSVPIEFVAKEKFDILLQALYNLRNCKSSYNTPEDLNHYIDSVLNSVGIK